MSRFQGELPPALQGGLPPRLGRIASLVPAGSVVADIGTDHALLPIYLVKSGICPRAIASELNPGPLERAREQVRSAGLEEGIDLRLGYGLSTLGPGEASVAVLAGMGGALIRRILETGGTVRESLRRLILQPMNGEEGLRRWLVENGYRMIDEDLVRDGDKIYQVIAAEPGRERQLSPAELELGPRNVERRGLLLVEEARYRVEHYRRIAARLASSGSPAAAGRLPQIEARIRALEGIAGVSQGRPDHADSRESRP